MTELNKNVCIFSTVDGSKMHLKAQRGLSHKSNAIIGADARYFFFLLQLLKRIFFLTYSVIINASFCIPEGVFFRESAARINKNMYL